jgi:CDP-glucose 4,6-dehydratase
MKELQKFYKNKKVFVTGHTGFKGSWLVNVLKELGANVVGFSLNDEKKKNYERFFSDKNIKNIYFDIQDYNKLFISLEKSEPEIVFHLAAQSLVFKSYSDPLQTFNTNIIGSLNVMEACRKIKSIKSVVIVTSDKCYKNIEKKTGYRETDSLGGDDPYSASKAAVEICFHSYFKSYFSKNSLKVGFATARAGNVVGGGDWSEDRLIPDCIRAIINNKKLFIRNPQATRPWQHVLEPIYGYLKLGMKLFHDPKKFSGSWNFGPDSGQIHSVKKVVKIITNFFENKKEIKIKLKKNLLKETKLLQLNCDKAKSILLWKTKWSIEKTIKSTCQWYFEYMNKNNLKLLTKRQIYEYFKKYD